MRTFAITGASVLGKAVSGMPTLGDLLVEAFRHEGLSVSVIKHAPDGFDIDTPGKASHRRREAGAREVMLVGDRRMVAFTEYATGEAEPSLESLLRCLDPVDIVIVEGYRVAAVPTLEIHRPSSGRAPRWRTNPHVVAIATDEPHDSPLPLFDLGEIAAIARFMAGPAQAQPSRLRAV